MVSSKPIFIECRSITMRTNFSITNFDTRGLNTSTQVRMYEIFYAIFSIKALLDIKALEILA